MPEIVSWYSLGVGDKIYSRLSLATEIFLKLACVYVVDDVIERRYVDIRDVDLGRLVAAADVTKRQHGGQVV